MKIMVLISRILVGSLFIVSGLIKANDALGFSYKLEEYFSPKALDLPFFEPYALGLAIFICIAEIVLGLAVLIGGRPKLTSALVMLMILFFTWLTYYTATCDPFEEFTVMRDGVEMTETKECVLECGCFGNAIPLTPWESFYKDVVLLVFVTIIFIASFFFNAVSLNTRREDLIILPISLLLILAFSLQMLDWFFPVIFAAALFGMYLLIKGFDSTARGEWIVALGAAFICGAFQYTTLAHLPMKDYRPYAIGNSVREGMMSAEERGLEPPVYAVRYEFTNTKTGKDTIVLSTDYLEKKLYQDDLFKNTYEVKNWQGGTIKLKDGYEPPIVDFSLQDFYGEDMTEDILNDKGYVFLQISYHVDAAKEGVQQGLNEFARQAVAAGARYYGVSSSSMEEIDEFRHEHQSDFPWLIADEKVLKTIVRANPGVVLLHDGVVVGKWHVNDLPVHDEVRAELMQ